MFWLNMWRAQCKIVHLKGVVTDLQAALLAQVISMQEHVNLLVGAGGHIRKEAVAGCADAPALAQERKAVQVFKT